MADPRPLKNDCFAMPPGVDWTPVDTALERLEAGMSPVAGQETVPLTVAQGRILAEDVVALRAHPPFANAAVDGYGFAAAALGAGPHSLPLAEGRAAAGAGHAGAVPKGSALRILTGAPVPEGVDTIVLEEDTDIDAEGRVQFGKGLKPGANTRPAGEDIAAGAVVLRAGRTLTPGDLAAMASTGIGSVPVRRHLRIAVMATGSELVPAGDPAGADQIFDANRPMLRAVLGAWGMEVMDLGIVHDSAAAIREALDTGAHAADAILTSGGASAGDEDHVSATLKAADALNTWRIAVKPGRPLALGLWHGTPVFGLPGNPVAAYVCMLVFARPALMRMSGAPWATPRGLTLPAAFDKRKKPGRTEYLRARLTEDGGAVEVFGSEGSGRVSGLSWSDGLVCLDHGRGPVQAGDPVRYIPYAEFGL